MIYDDLNMKVGKDNPQPQSWAWIWIHDVILTYLLQFQIKLPSQIVHTDEEIQFWVIPMTSSFLYTSKYNHPESSYNT